MKNRITKESVKKLTNQELYTYYEHYKIMAHSVYGNNTKPNIQIYNDYIILRKEIIRRQNQ